MMISISLISGVMLGLEFIWGEALVVDLLIIRLIFQYNNIPPEGFT